MNPWTIFVYLLVAGAGVLAFLHTVACEVSRSSQILNALEVQEKRREERRHAAEVREKETAA